MIETALLWLPVPVMLALIVLATWAMIYLLNTLPYPYYRMGVAVIAVGMSVGVVLGWFIFGRG